MIGYRNLAKESPPCPLCEGKVFQKLATNDRYGMGVQTAGCLQCGLVQTWPRPTPEEMDAFYSYAYRQVYQAAVTPDAKYVARYHKVERLSYTAKLIASRINFFKGMRVLDIGCAEGTLLSNLKSHCKELVLVGVEPSESFAAYARKETGCTTYSNLNALILSREDKFDLVLVNHVLEHVNNPVTFIKSLKELTVIGGRIYIDVPDIAHYGHAENLHIGHLFHFSQRTLVAAVEKAGFSIQTTKSHAPPHHPASVFCLAEKKDSSSSIGHTKAQYEMNAWENVRKANRAIKFYLFKQWLARTWIMSRCLRDIRKLASFLRKKVNK